MLRLLSWSSSLGGDKINMPGVKILTSPEHQPALLDSQVRKKLKRKRIEGSGTEQGRRPVKRRLERVSHVLVPKQSTTTGASLTMIPTTMSQQAPEPSGDSQPQDLATSDSASATEAARPAPLSTSRTEEDIDKMRQVINSEISLEILLKHKELRLIDQEVAKCQIALEQIRRCTEIPYPGTQGALEDVSMGGGPSLRSSFSGPLPKSPAPWGLTDGPYSRHYAKWLLPDPTFDGGEVNNGMASKTPGKTSSKGRVIRGTLKAPAGNTLTPRSQRSGKLKALSNGYPQPKEKVDRVIQKRKSDGQVIKLVCLDCRREDFNSPQGFINHCRIAHSRHFVSHDAAADACGEPVEIDDAGMVVGGDALGTSVAGMVHPLIRSAHLLQGKNDSPRATKQNIDIGSSKDGKINEPLRLRGGTGTGSIQSTPTCIPSPLTPHLSAFIDSKGLDLNLYTLVAAAKAPVDWDESSGESDGDMADDPALPEATFRGRHPQVAGAKQPVRSTTSPHPSEQQSTPIKHPKPQRQQQQPGNDLDNSVTASRAGYLPTSLPPLTFDGAADDEGLEPSPTNESNQAPSLVDDDDDDDYAAQSPSLSSSVSGEAEDEEDLHFEVEDDETSGPSSRTPSAVDSEYASEPKMRVMSTAQPAGRRRSALRNTAGSRIAKHVSFVSPSPARELPGRKQKELEKKRRRS